MNYFWSARNHKLKPQEYWPARPLASSISSQCSRIIQGGKKKELIGAQHLETETKSNNNKKSEMMPDSLTPEFKSAL